jgi:hypothetical protein
MEGSSAISLSEELARKFSRQAYFKATAATGFAGNSDFTPNLFDSGFDNVETDTASGDIGGREGGSKSRQKY